MPRPLRIAGRTHEFLLLVPPPTKQVEPITFNNMQKYAETDLRGATLFSNRMLQGAPGGLGACSAMRRIRMRACWVLALAAAAAASGLGCPLRQALPTHAAPRRAMPPHAMPCHANPPRCCPHAPVYCSALADAGAL